jgi:hypothetical protein
MMAIALLGTVLNLYVIWKVRRLRHRQSAQWRQKPLSAKKKHSEQLQIVLSILTLILLAAEWITHPLVHRVPLFSINAPNSRPAFVPASSLPPAAGAIFR